MHWTWRRRFPHAAEHITEQQKDYTLICGRRVWRKPRRFGGMTNHNLMMSRWHHNENKTFNTQICGRVCKGVFTGQPIGCEDAEAQHSFTLHIISTGEGWETNDGLETDRSHRLVRNTRVVVTPTHPQLWMPLNGIISLWWDHKLIQRVFTDVIAKGAGGYVRLLQLDLCLPPAGR